VLYDREVPFELRVQEGTDGPQQVGTLEAIKVKVLVQGEDAQPQGVRVELSSEADLFFHYMHVIDETGFREMQEQQKLMVEFADYPAVLVSALLSHHLLALIASASLRRLQRYNHSQSLLLAKCNACHLQLANFTAVRAKSCLRQPQVLHKPAMNLLRALMLQSCLRCLHFCRCEC
jgi:Centriolar protein SAS N-terminal